MKTTQLIAAAALTLVAAAGVQAETYDGVHPLTRGASRAELSVQATTAARAGNPYGEATHSGVQAIASVNDRSNVRAEAVAKAHDPLASLDRRAFYRDQVPAAYSKPRVSFTRQAGL